MMRKSAQSFMLPISLWMCGTLASAPERSFYLEPIPGRSGFFAILVPEADQQIERQTPRGCLDV